MYHETGPPNQCQCLIECNSPALKGQAFCQAHLHSCPVASPLSGWEPEYDPELWNNNKAFKGSHNCYSYAMNVYDPKQVEKCKRTKNCNVPYHLPGAASGYEKFSNDRPKVCPNMLSRLFGDNSSIVLSDFQSKCPNGYSKISLIIDENEDYHFLRQDSNAYWSHKPGGNRVTPLDAFDHPIWNPKLANYNYVLRKDSSLNYDVFCSFLCVPRNRPLYLRVGGGGAKALRELFGST